MQSGTLHSALVLRYRSNGERASWMGWHPDKQVQRPSMIQFQHVSKSYHIRKFRKDVFYDLDFTIQPGESIGICGANGAGKSTLMRLIAGIEYPTTGKVVRTMTTSWPIGYGSCFQGSLTGADNT